MLGTCATQGASASATYGIGNISTPSYLHPPKTTKRPAVVGVTIFRYIMEIIRQHSYLFSIF